MHRDPAHYLAGVKTTRTPKRLAFFDVQPEIKQQGGVKKHSWQCGALGTTHWTARTNSQKDTLKVFQDPYTMWETLDKFCLPSRRVVMFTYDLPAQLRLSQALLILPRFGWHLTTVVLEPGASWALFKDDKRSLMLCDLKSWTPYNWDRVQSATMSKRQLDRLPKVGKDPVATMAFNRVQIIRKAVLQIIAWIERDQLGPFRPTGSGQGYSAFRRRFMQHRILVHDDVSRLQVERQSMFAGRTEAWKHGAIQGGPFVEIDMKAAYTRIASQCDLPTVALGTVVRPGVKGILNAEGKYTYLCHVEVEIETPVAPKNVGSHTIFPTGRFDTWVWTPELHLLDQYATRIHVTRAYKYRTEGVLKEFSTYVLSTLDLPPADTLGLPYLVMKHWSRTLVGRFGLRYRSWIPFSDDGDFDLSMCTFIDIDTNTMTDMLCVGNDMLLLDELTESVESVPQIPAWVMSECRRRLWETMVDIGLERIVYVDTDSIIFDTNGDRRFEREVVSRHSDLWALKGRYTSLSIQGPRNICVDDDRRVSGLPLGAVRLDQGRYRGEVLRSIRESMRHDDLDTVVKLRRDFVFTATDIKRKHLPQGKTEAFNISNVGQVLEI